MKPADLVAEGALDVDILLDKAKYRGGAGADA